MHFYSNFWLGLLYFEVTYTSIEISCFALLPSSYTLWIFPLFNVRNLNLSRLLILRGNSDTVWGSTSMILWRPAKESLIRSNAVQTRCCILGHSLYKITIYTEFRCRCLHRAQTPSICLNCPISWTMDNSWQFIFKFLCIIKLLQVC